MSWKYKPFRNGEFNTLWELGLQLVDQYRQEYPFDNQSDEELMNTEGLPALVQWIFAENGKVPPIDFSKPEWDTFIKRFTIHFLNREIAYKNAFVWRVRLMEVLVKSQFFLEEGAQPVYQLMATAAAKQTNRRTSTDNGTNTRTHEGTGTEERSIKRTDILEGTAQNDKQTDTTRTTTLTTKADSQSNDTRESKDNETASGTNTQNQRDLNSDMPQSVVNQATMGNPELQTWTYASGMTDRNAKTTDESTRLNSGTQTGQSTGTSNTDSNGTDTFAGTETGTDHRTESRTGNDSTTGSTTRKDSDTETRSGTQETTDEIESLTPLQTARERYNFFMEHMTEPVQALINKTENLFISGYVEEERMGFMDWASMNSLTKNIYKE